MAETPDPRLHLRRPVSRIHHKDTQPTVEIQQPQTKPTGDFVSDYIPCCLEAVRKIQMGPIQFLMPFANSKTEESRLRAWRYVDVFVEQALELRRSGKLDDNTTDDGDEGPEYNFLRELAKDTDDPVELRSQILNILLASRDTTACLLGNFLYSVLRHPEMNCRLREGLKRGWGVKIGGLDPILVRKGTIVLFYVFAMHRRTGIFGTDVDDFRPERWGGLQPGWGFLPFNGGVRICIGCKPRSPFCRFCELFPLTC